MTTFFAFMTGVVVGAFIIFGVTIIIIYNAFKPTRRGRRG